MALQCRWHFAVPVVYGAFTVCGAGTDAPELDCALLSEHLYSGCVSRGGIPALTNPDINGASNASLFIRDFARVLDVVVNGVARAYPFNVLWWHEIATASFVQSCPSQDPERLETPRSPPSTNMEALWRLSCQQFASHPGSAPGVQRHLERAAS